MTARAKREMNKTTNVYIHFVPHRNPLLFGCCKHGTELEGCLTVHLPHEII